MITQNDTFGVFSIKKIFIKYKLESNMRAIVPKI